MVGREARKYHLRRSELGAKSAKNVKNAENAKDVKRKNNYVQNNRRLYGSRTLGYEHGKHNNKF